MENYADLMFHEAVAELQKEDGSYAKYQKLYPHRRQEAFSEADLAFLQSRESIYMASVDPEGWPYVQHRGGPRGFLKLVGDNKIVCADYAGNRQFISMGNLARDDRVSLFAMDYENQRRLKMQARARLRKVADVEPEVLEVLDEGGPEAERVLELDVIAMDWNCPKYIPRMYSEAALREVIGPRIAALEAENARLREAQNSPGHNAS